MIERQYTNETNTVLLERMLARVPNDIDKRQGSVVYDMLAPSSIELAQAYIALDDVLAFGLNVNADSPASFVDLKVSWQGLTRKPAIFATGTLTFEGADATVIPAGTQVRTDSANPQIFETLEEATISGSSVTVDARATVGGSAGNVALGTITVVLGGLSGAVTVTNEDSFSGGVDQESNADLLARYYEKVQRPATSGNIYQYEQWAKSVAGVGDAKGEAIWAGAGTVRLTLIDGNKQVPSAEIVEAVEDYVESVRPIGAIVTYQAATALNVNVSATLTLSPEVVLSTAKAEFEGKLTEYLKGIAFKDNAQTGVRETVRYSQIANLLLDTTGVLDYASLTVNGGTSNIQPTFTQVPVKGTVTLT